jgi:hypothetical protein
MSIERVKCSSTLLILKTKLMSDNLKVYLERKMIELSLAKTAEDKIEVLQDIYNAGHTTCMEENF